MNDLDLTLATQRAILTIYDNCVKTKGQLDHPTECTIFAVGREGGMVGSEVAIFLDEMRPIQHKITREFSD
jgi:hypothetical protein